MQIVARNENNTPTIRVYGYLGSLNTQFLNCAFDKGDNSWVLPYGELHNLMQCFSALPYVYVDEVSRQLTDGADTLLQSLKEQTLSANYIHKTTPFKHQVEGYYYGLACPRFLLGDEQGLGKTKQAIDLAVNRKALYGIRHCLIIAGVSSLRFNWAREIEKHSDEGCHILGQRTLRNGRVALKMNKEKLEDAKRLTNGELPFFVVTNIESIRDPGVRQELVNACANGEIGMIVFDEFHRCFSYDTLVETEEGPMKIGDIVENKLDVRVFSFDETTKKVELSEVVDWHRNTNVGNMVELTFDIDGVASTVVCTEDHRFYTKNRGWVMAKDLTEDDDLLGL